VVLDTNIVIYACQPGGAMLLPWTGSADAAVASVTRVEALGFRGIGPDEEADLREFLAECTVLPLDDEVIERAVLLRQQKKMKLGDTIIAATALEYGQALVTRNVDDFKHIAGLQSIVNQSFRHEDQIERECE
jgi:predicted nucleic acid-binding protein